MIQDDGEKKKAKVVKVIANMSKTKTEAKAPDKAKPGQIVQKQPETPEKRGGPSRAAQTTTSALPPPDGTGATNRARIMRAMQGTVGNARLSRMLGTAMQAKLTVSAPNDPYEQEADRVARQVASKATSPSQQAAQRQIGEEERLQAKPLVQRQVEEEPMQTKLLIQPQVEEEEPLQTKRQATSASSALQRQPTVANAIVEPDVEASIQRARGGGQSLGEGVREPVEQALGVGFGGVKVHTDTQADTLNRSLNARAFTVGQDIFFKQGEYNPGSSAGQGLLSHELAHVAQQSADRPRRKPSGGWLGDRIVHKAPPSVQRYEPYEHIELGEVEALIGPDEASYVVKKGETLAAIAAKFGISVEKLKARNAAQLKTWTTSKGRKIQGFSAGENIIIPADKVKVEDRPRTLAPETSKQKMVVIKGVKLKYGEVIALGDFYASPYDLYLASAGELKKLVALFRKEKAKPGSVTTDEWNRATGGRYLELAKKNVAHFAPPDPKLVPTTGASSVNCRTEWEKYHKEAIKLAQTGDKSKALTVNAFGDHFLTDAFSAGHLVNKPDLMAKFSKTLESNEKMFFDQVAKVVFKEKSVKDYVSKYETVQYKGVIFRPNIDSAGRFSKLLQGIHAEEPGLVENAIAKTVHDALNIATVEVKNAKGDTWRLSGDGSLNAATQAIALKAVAQSQVNVLNSVGKTGALNYGRLHKLVWDYVPRPTSKGIKEIGVKVSELANPAKKATVDAVARIIKSNITTILDELVKRNELKKT